MNITSETHLAATVLTISGELSVDEADSFQRKVRDTVENFNSNVIVDCSELTLIDSVGLESLLWLSDELNRNGNKLKFATVSQTVQRVFQLTRLNRVFSTYESIEQAAKSFA